MRRRVRTSNRNATRQWGSFPLRLIVVLSLCMGAVLVGCARSRYREAADREAYCLIKSRESDPRWDLPTRNVEPSRVSRMYVAAEQDCGPKPPDDPAAHRYMVRPDSKKIHYYQKIGTRGNVENPIWMDYLPRDEDGTVQLSQTLAMDLGLIHSREYQDQFEDVYLTALSLSGNRFEFDTQWFGGGALDYRATGSDLGGNQFLTLSKRLGFTKNLAGGGQFATEFLNNLSWNFAGNGTQFGSAAIVSTFTQPLLRGAFRHVRLENLTQAERDLLYQVRGFARFRRQFYVNLTEDYLGLLTQAQAIRNIESNVENLAQNLEEHRFLFDLARVSQVQVDQVYQEFQRGRSDLLSAEQGFITSEDRYKFTLGLPAWLSFDLDESLLEPFELVSPELVALQDDAQELYESLVQYLPPERAPVEKLKTSFEEFKLLRVRVAELLPVVEADLATWTERLKTVDRSRLTEADLVDLEQQDQLAGQIDDALAELSRGLSERETFNANLLQKITEYETNPPKDTPADEQKTLEEILQQFDSLEDVTIEDILPDEKDDTGIEAWNALEDAIGTQLRLEMADLYVAQTQIKLFLIDIDPFTIDYENAVSFAHQNRLDLMNSRAQVVDAFRAVEVAADALESDLDVSGGVRIGSDPDSNSPFKLDGNANVYNVGIEFDGPLNRLNERNVYRATQIAYQQANRDFLATKDVIANEVRLILRQLELNRLNFQIARQTVVSASRLVDQAQIDLRQSTESDSNLTIVLLGALEGMLNAKNQLIGNWVAYRVQKMRLFEALELLYLDENGRWINEQSGLEMLQNYEAVDPEYFPPLYFSPMQRPVPPPEVTSDSVENSLPAPLSEALPGDPELIEAPLEEVILETPAP